MATISATLIKNGLSTLHRGSFCQYKDVVVFGNGHDSNLVANMRGLIGSSSMTSLGIAAPTAAPGAAVQGTGLTGTYRYRCRWYDALAGTFSLPSATVSIALANQGARITQPASPPSRVTHWIIERTVDSGTVFYPVNVSTVTENGYGTAIATTTYDDATAAVVTDSILRQRTAFDERQSPPSRYYPIWLSNDSRVFGLGGRVHTSAATVTSGSASVTGLTGCTTAMAGEDFAMDGDADGRTYRVASATATTITLAENYAGTSRTATCTVTGRRDEVCWSEPGQPEYFGTQITSGTIIGPGCSNTWRIGSKGDPLLAGVGWGEAGVLYAKRNALFLHAYDMDPDPIGGDGNIIEVAGRRGVLSSRTIINIHGTIYGMDRIGVWRMRTGGEPEEIGGAIQHDFRRTSAPLGMRLTRAEWFFMVHYPQKNQLWIFCVDRLNTHPDKAWVWDIDHEKWLGHYPFGNVATCGCNLPDQRGNEYPVVFNYPSNLTAPAYAWMLDRGVTAGALLSGTSQDDHPEMYRGTVTSGTANTLSDSGASWYTSEEKLKGVMVVKIKSDGTNEARMISDNTGTQLTVARNWTDTPQAGDTYVIGSVEFQMVTGRFDAGLPHRKKDWKTLHIWCKKRTNAVSFTVRFFADDDKTAATPWGVTKSESGVSYTLSQKDATVDSSGLVRFSVPCHIKSNTLQICIYSRNPGVPFEIKRMRLEPVLADGGEIPTKA